MIELLIESLVRNRGNLAYANINTNNQYNGWTQNFNIKLTAGESMRLDLSQERDLFLLFVLASAWSKTGAWENAAFFTTYLKMKKKDNIELWLDENFVENEITDRRNNALNIVASCTGVIPRKKVSFRQDYYSSIVVLAKNWNQLKSKLEESNEFENYWIFIDYISKIEGLGSGKNKMRIKIPLILRELRCQKIYDNIPGELCCVPDERVKGAAKALGIKMPNVTSINTLFKASQIIYENFGDLYDIPLFAYEDLKHDFK